MKDKNANNPHLQYVQSSLTLPGISSIADVVVVVVVVVVIVVVSIDQLVPIIKLPPKLCTGPAMDAERVGLESEPITCLTPAWSTNSLMKAVSRVQMSSPYTYQIADCCLIIQPTQI